MAINRWLGVAQARIAKQALQPLNIKPGSVWVLRIGSASYTYVFPDSIEDDNLTDNDRAQAVCQGLVSAYSGGAGFGGGSTTTVASVESQLNNGRWSVVVTGNADGSPLDVSLTGQDPTSSSVSVIELQAGRAARNEIQTVKFPGTPTAGTWFVRYRNALTSALAYNITAANLETALEGLASIGAGNVAVAGSYTAGYTVTFQGALAGTDCDLLVAYSDTFEGTTSYRVEVTQVGGIGRQTYLLPAFNGDANVVYRFRYDGQDSHLFSGSPSVSILRSALEDLVGTGNVEVVQNDDLTYTLALVGDFVGQVGEDLSLIDVSAGGTATVLDSSDPSLTETDTIVQLTVLGMPLTSTGTFALTYQGATTAGININGVSTASINSALALVSIPWTCNSVSDFIHGALVITLQSTAIARVDAGVVLMDVSNLVGCYAIDVRTTQTAQSARNEIQQIVLLNEPTGGTFTLAFGANTTAGLAYNISAASMQTALQGLASIGAGGALVSGPDGGPWIVEFASSLAAADQALISGNGASLTLPTAASVTVVVMLSPTGPNWWSNASNWSLGVVPDSDDVATFDAGSIGCLYGIDSVAAIAGIDVYRSYTGQIGLAEFRADGNPETLTQYLGLSDGGGVIPVRIGLGDDGAGPSLVRINVGSQDSTATVLFSQQSTGEQLYTVGLEGALNTVHAADCSLQIATRVGSTATVGVLRVSPRGGASDGAVVELGSGATVTTLNVVAGTVRCASVPANLIVDSGDVTVRGSGTLESAVIRGTVRYLAAGRIGKSAAISVISLNSDDEARLTSNGHGLASGDRVFLSGVVGVVGLPDGFYTVLRVDANNFDLVGTDPEVPFGAVDPTTPGSFYEAGTADWGIADAVRVGVAGVLDFSELSEVRTLVAPILLQSPDAVVLDPLGTVNRLRLKSDPSSYDAALGNRALILRE